ncbi:MAG: ethylbenzene dehydrogenase-related protein [Candidatus Geothermarchaeales archaeon]
MYRPRDRGISILAVLFLLAFSLILTDREIPTVASQEINLQSKGIQAPLPLTEPLSPLWDEATLIEVPLNPQVTTQPLTPFPSIRTLTARTLNNGTWIAFLLEWQDSTKDMSTAKTELFRDAAALQFPTVTELPYVCMGQAGNDINIWHWKGDWQADIEGAFSDVTDVYPNFWVNYYPFALGEPPYSHPSSFNESKRFIAGWEAGNPLSDPARVSSVEDLFARGFGTLTTQPHQDVLGWGKWNAGEWKVVFSRPLSNADRDDTQFQTGQTKPIAFAVWDGSNGEVDGKKSVSTWLTLEVESPRPLAEPFVFNLPLLVLIGSIWVVSILILAFWIFLMRRKK